MQIAMLIFDDFTSLDAIGPYEILNRLPHASVSFVAEKAGPVVADSGALTMLASSLEDVPAPDILVVAGGRKGQSRLVRMKRFSPGYVRFMLPAAIPFPSVLAPGFLEQQASYRACALPPIGVALNDWKRTVLPM